MPEIKDQEVKDQEVKDQEIEGQEKKETPTQDDIVYTQVIEGQELKLTEEQLNRVVYLGLQKANEIQKSREKPKTQVEKKEEIKNPEKATNNEVAELKAEMSKREIASVNDEVEEFFEDLSDVSPYFKKILKQQAFIAIATAKQNGDHYNPTRICKTLVKTYKDETSAQDKKRIDFEQKEKDRKKTELDTKSKGAGQDSPPQLGRKSFRDGTLSKRVAEHLNKLGED